MRDVLLALRRWRPTVGVAVLVGVVSGAWPLAARAEGEVAFFPVEGTSIDPAEAIEIGELLAEEFARVSGQPVLYPDQVRKFAEASESLEQAASALAVAQYVAIRAVQLKQGLRIVAVLHQADGSIVHRVSLRVASVDAFADEAGRVAQALVQQKPLAAGAAAPRAPSAERAAPGPPPEAEDVAPRPQVSVARRPAERLFLERTIGFKVQTHVIMAVGHVFDPTVSGQFALRLEGSGYFIEFAAGLMVPIPVMPQTQGVVRQFWGVVSELGAAYYITQDSMAWSVGGGIQPRLLLANGIDMSVYIAPYVQVGVEFLRDKSLRVFVDLRVAQNIIPAQFYSLSNDVSHEVFATETGFQVGMGW